MNKLVKKLIALMTVVLMLTAANVYAAGAELVSCNGYMKNGSKITSIRFVSNAERFEMVLKNNSENKAKYALILVGYDSKGVCKCVEISEAFEAASSEPVTVKMPVVGSELKSFSSLKFIAVEVDETGMYPVVETVKELGTAWN